MGILSPPLAIALQAVVASNSQTPFGSNPAPFVALMAIGFIVGIAGHMAKSNGAVALGIALVFLGTAILPLLVYLLDG